MKIRNKLYLFLGLLVLIVLTFQIIDSYGIFESNISSDTSSNLSKWQILINTSDITGEVSTFTIPQVHWEANAGVVPGKAAPGLSGYFEILINPIGSEVSMEYELSLDFLDLNNDMIYITSVKDGDGVALTQVDTNMYSGIITLAEIELLKIQTIRVDFIWENDESNNEADSIYIEAENPFLDIPISIRLSQYIE